MSILLYYIIILCRFYSEIIIELMVTTNHIYMIGCNQ